MAQINGILNIVVQQDANELRMGCDRTPSLLAGGIKKKFIMPQTSGEMLRGLLGELYSDEVRAELRSKGESVVDYEIPSGEVFKTRFKGREHGEDFDVVFMLAEENAAAPLGGPGGDEPTDGPSMPAALASEPVASGPVAVSGLVAAPVARIYKPPKVTPALASLLSRAVMLRASDLHLGRDELPTVRVDGQLQPMIDMPAADTEKLLEGCMVPQVVASLDAGRSADLSLKVPSLGRFRVNIYRSSVGLTAAIRLLPEAAPKLQTLNLPVDLSPLSRFPHGLVIVTGPTGSGKSSTLAALAQEALVTRSALLISLEDPIEYALRTEGRGGLVRQREIGRHARDFATGLRDALREDPDVILVGEMRDQETVRLALTAAETGHLVLTSLHSRSAPAAIDRILDACPPDSQNQIRAQLADSLRAVVSQCLLPRRHGRGRVPALEVLRVTHSVASLIREGRTPQIISAIQAGRAEGMIQLERSLADRVNEGDVREEVALEVANDRSAFMGYLDRGRS